MSHQRHRVPKPYYKQQQPPKTKNKKRFAHRRRAQQQQQRYRQQPKPKVLNVKNSTLKASNVQCKCNSSSNRTGNNRPKNRKNLIKVIPIETYSTTTTRWRSRYRIRTTWARAKPILPRISPRLLCSVLRSHLTHRKEKKQKHHQNNNNNNTKQPKDPSNHRSTDHHRSLLSFQAEPELPTTFSPIWLSQRNKSCSKPVLNSDLRAELYRQQQERLLQLSSSSKKQQQHCQQSHSHHHNHNNIQSSIPCKLPLLPKVLTRQTRTNNNKSSSHRTLLLTLVLLVCPLLAISLLLVSVPFSSSSSSFCPPECLPEIPITYRVTLLVCVLGLVIMLLLSSLFDSCAGGQQDKKEDMSMNNSYNSNSSKSPASEHHRKSNHSSTLSHHSGCSGASDGAPLWGSRDLSCTSGFSTKGSNSGQGLSGSGKQQQHQQPLLEIKIEKLALVSNYFKVERPPPPPLPVQSQQQQSQVVVPSIVLIDEHNRQSVGKADQDQGEITSPEVEPYHEALRKLSLSSFEMASEFLRKYSQPDILLSREWPNNISGTRSNSSNHPPFSGSGPDHRCHHRLGLSRHGSACSSTIATNSSTYSPNSVCSSSSNESISTEHSDHYLEEPKKRSAVQNGSRPPSSKQQQQMIEMVSSV